MIKLLSDSFLIGVYLLVVTVGGLGRPPRSSRKFFKILKVSNSLHRTYRLKILSGFFLQVCKVKILWEELKIWKKYFSRLWRLLSCFKPKWIFFFKFSGLLTIYKLYNQPLLHLLSQISREINMLSFSGARFVFWQLWNLFGRGWIRHQSIFVQAVARFESFQRPYR